MHDAVADLTARQRLLVAAAKLEAAGHSPFTAEDLTVAAWKESPGKFGLKGYQSEHPDSNATYTLFMGYRGLPAVGYMAKVGPKLYTLTRQGREEADRIASYGADADPLPGLPARRPLAKIQVPKELEQQLVALFTTTAFRRYEEGMKREITYRDACRFWALAESAHGDAVDQTLTKVLATLAAVEQLLIGDSIELSNGQSVSQADLKSLAAVHRFLMDNFQRNLEQQRKRRGRF
jgi:hypothetical protein